MQPKESLDVANADEIVRQRCQASEAAERRERTLYRALRATQEELSNIKEENTKLDYVIAAKDLVLAQKEARILELEAKLTQAKIVF